MQPVGLWGSLQMNLFECVSGYKKRISSAQQADVCRAIPLHNYLRTSGACKPTAGVSSSHCLSFLSLFPLPVEFEVLPLLAHTASFFPHTLLRTTQCNSFTLAHAYSVSFISLPPCFLFLSPLSSSFGAAFACHSFWLLSKHHLRSNNGAHLLFKQSPRPHHHQEDCHLVCACVAYSQHKSPFKYCLPCKWLYAW